MQLDVLLVSDDPELKSFQQILGLRYSIEQTKTNVDLLVLSEKGILLNQKLIGEAGQLARSLENVFSRRFYSVVAISLTIHHLENLLNKRVLDSIAVISPQTDFFVFGGPSLLQNLEDRPRFHLYPRPGVNKITSRFKVRLIEYIRKKKELAN